MRKQLTLCVPVKDNQILLGMKKRGFGAGRWNGFGGKIESGETIEQGARRELYEEAGINDGSLEKVGILDFSFQNVEEILEVHIFRLGGFSQTAIETEEMKPRWFAFNDIPFSQMWSDDVYWFPLFLQNKLFKGAFLFDRAADTKHPAQILEYSLEEVAMV